jgi:hypothetical protein
LALVERLAFRPPHQEPPEDLPRPRNVLAEEPADLGHVAQELAPQPFDVQAVRFLPATRQGLPLGHPRAALALLGGLQLATEGVGA